MDRKPAAQISLQRRFEHLYLQRLTENNLPGFLVVAAAEVAENRVQEHILVLDRFACPRAVAGVVALQGRVILGQVALGVVRDFRHVNDVGFSHTAFEILLLLDKCDHLVRYLLGEEQLAFTLAFPNPSHEGGVLAGQHLQFLLLPIKPEYVAAILADETVSAWIRPI